MADTLEDLAARCESATGPDRELDALIRCAVFASDGAFVRQSPINGAWCIYEIGYNGKERPWEPRDLAQEQRVGAFTDSLDAAMTLVPKGVSFAIGRGIETELGDSATDYAWCGSKDEPHEGPYYWAATPALALCAASLRAIAKERG